MVMRVMGLCLSLFVGVVSLHAQDVRINGGFLADSLGIGDEGGYYLTARYPSELNILFPDSKPAINGASSRCDGSRPSKPAWLRR